MSKFKIILIDVGWGDSIFLESTDDAGQTVYALIDSNDTVYDRASFIFLKKYFERKNIVIPRDKPVFDFVLLTHAHADHAQGLKNIIKEYGTKNFWYPKSLNWKSFSTLIDYANRSPNVVHHQAIDSSKINMAFGDVPFKVLWPPYDKMDPENENNNSVVLLFTHGNQDFILSGDAEEEVWNQISGNIPLTTKYFKVPHHGSVNGTFGPQKQTPWLDHCPANSLLAISSHIRPFGHPDQKVVDAFTHKNFHYLRTDENYHIEVISENNNIETKYSHI